LNGTSCDSLSKKELWYICNNQNFIHPFCEAVVIRFQKRNFDIFATICPIWTKIHWWLWFAFKKGTLIYLQQLSNLTGILENSCDSLSKKELWYICNNCLNANSRLLAVVIRFQKRNFDIFATMVLFNKHRTPALWFAFKKGTLIYLQQSYIFSKNYSPSCDSLSKKELWYICNNKYKCDKIPDTVVIRFQKRNFDIFATIQPEKDDYLRMLWFAFKKGTLIYLQQLFIHK